MTLEQIFQKWQSLQPLSELAEHIGINRSAMQKLLKSMSEKGYIVRSEKDGLWHVVAVSTK